MRDVLECFRKLMSGDVRERERERKKKEREIERQTGK